MPRLLAPALIALIGCAAVGREPLASAGEFRWTGWLGPERNAWVGDFEPPARWPDQLALAWETTVGTGYGSPLVVDEFVYQHARQNEEEVVWCLELATGAVKWRQSYPVPFKMGGGGERHGKGPKSSPAWAAGRLFTLSITGLLSAWDAATGELFWRRDYGAEFDKGHPYWGASTSPLIDGSRVVVHFGTDDRGALLALDAKSGEEVWRHGKAGPSYASPILAEIDDVRQIIELNMQGLVSVDSDSGRRLWSYAYPQANTDQNMVTPAFGQGLVLLGGENRGLRGLQPRRANGKWTVQEAWFQDKVALDMSTAVVNDGLLYGFSHYASGRLFCLDIQTGKILWQGPGRAGENATFLAIPGYVMALMNHGQLQIIKASGGELEQVAKYRVADDRTWAPPVLLPGGILVKDHDTLRRWSLAEPESSSTPPR